ncbi:prepilin-type N-terminal cleavage/methylation domain-containing protein [Patescibacteria group bacterium]|nr:prepilin-type N-terminal cleavage/methylation domain-containing protein [Patescibacteria group bacterium]
MKKEGFTIIELLVVITIIGILTSISVVSLNEIRKNSRDSKRISDLERIQTALDFYFIDNHDYPSDYIETGEDISEYKLGYNNYKALCENGFKTSCDALEKTYMGIIPIPAYPPYYSGFYYVKINEDNPNYKIFFYLEAGFEDLNSGFYTATPNGIYETEGEDQLFLNELLEL